MQNCCYSLSAAAAFCSVLLLFLLLLVLVTQTAELSAGRLSLSIFVGEPWRIIASMIINAFCASVARYLQEERI